VNRIEVENRGLDEKIFTAICGMQDWSPLFKALGLRFTYLGEGVAGISMYPSPIYSSHPGRVNGGIIAVLADNVMGMAAITLGNIVRSVEINMNYLAPVFDEKMLTGEGYVISAGRSIIVAEANLSNDQGKLAAKSRGTFIVERNSPLMEQARLLTDKTVTDALI